MAASKLSVAGFVLGLVVSCGYFWVLSSPHAQLAAAEPKDSQLKQLYSERVDVLTKIVEELTAARSNAMASIEQVHHARLNLLQAELEQADTAKDRVAILEKLWEFAKEREQVAIKLVEKGAGSSTYLLQTKADRLGAEIAWQRAKME
ncbi:MAG: hypothetical protein JWM11_2297 [Planctomycetaceae bacterium]|nr:hypothetical protein [Planctomycetaceae bacterium]